MKQNTLSHSTHTTAKALTPTWADGVCRISAEFIKANRKFVGLGTFEVFRAFASHSGGYLSLKDIQKICATYRVNYGTIRSHLKLCAEKGFIKKVEDGFKWKSERYLHEEIAGRPWNYLGANSVTISFDKLIGFLGKSRKHLSMWVIKNIDLNEISDLQNKATEGMEQMMYKKYMGKVVKIRGEEVGMEDIEEKRDFYAGRKFVFDGSMLSSSLKDANSNVRVVVNARSNRKAKKVEKVDSGDSIGQVEGNLTSDRRNALCSIEFGVPWGVSSEGEAFSHTRSNNVTSLYSEYPLTGRDIYFAPADRMVRGSKKVNTRKGDNITTIKEANVSLSKLSAITGWSASTLSKNLRQPQEDMIIRDHIMVLGKYSAVNVNAINIHYDQANVPIRGRFFARRMSTKSLGKLAAKGTQVEWCNLDGSIQDVQKARVLTVLMFQRAYFLIKSDETPLIRKDYHPVKANTTNLKKKELIQSTHRLKKA